MFDILRVKKQLSKGNGVEAKQSFKGDPIMENSLKSISQGAFENIKKTNEQGCDYWSSRELGKMLGYAEYRNFQPVIEKAKEACSKSGNDVQEHFVDEHEMIDIGNNTKRLMPTVLLSRYACYLIVQNADSAKEIVALGQTYFAVQTRKQEVIEQKAYDQLQSDDEKRVFLRNEMKTHNKQLAEAARVAGVIEPQDYAIFQNHGYQGLYGGLGKKQIHARKQLKKSQDILDHMGSTELAANLFRATQTEEKLLRDNIKGKTKANQVHYEVGKKVRQTIQELGGTMPENLVAQESIKKVESRVKKANKQIK
jgi:DNA-damage-inducible protein D